MLLWLDATDPTTLFQDSALTIPAGPGDDIGGWKDKSGLNHHAFQDDDFLRPTVEATAMNGLPAVRFFGADGDGMAIDESLVLERPYTAFIVNQYHDSGFRGRTLQGLDANWLHGLWSARFGHYAEGWVASIPAEVGFPYVEDTTGDIGGNSTFYANGAEFAINSAPSGAPGRLGLVSVGMFPGEVSDADVSEIVIYDRILNANELTQVRDFLYTKYKAESLEDLVLTPQNTVLKGRIGTFSGADPGEGLDLEGEFPYALDVGGFGDVTVGDATFTDASAGGSTPGANVEAVNEILDWHPAGEYGDTENDDNLEIVMESIRWSPYPEPVTVDLDVEPGTPYRLQLLFAESCCDRGYDIVVEGELVVDNINVQVVQEGINNGTQGVYYTLDLVAGDDELNISLEGLNLRAPDNNPILNGVTLEVTSGVPGDFNSNGSLDAADLDQMSAAIRAGTTNVLYDLDANSVIDQRDRTVWVEQLKHTYFGDSNLDGQFNSADFVQVFQAGKYEDGAAGNANWSEGDWDGNGDFDSSDFVLAFQGGGYEKGPRPGVAGVPEPTGIAILVMGLVGLLSQARRATLRS
jgi:hypothetical protein